MGRITTIIPVESISGKLGGKTSPIGFAKRTMKNKDGLKVNYSQCYSKRTTPVTSDERKVRALFKKRAEVRQKALQDVHRYDQLAAAYKKSSFQSFNAYIWHWLRQEVTPTNYTTYVYQTLQA